MAIFLLSNDQMMNSKQKQIDFFTQQYHLSISSPNGMPETKQIKTYCTVRT